VGYAGVERFIDTPIKRYSSGMRLRLGFAVAAHLDPDVLIVDEVLAVGDAGFQKKCLNTMEGMHSGGRTVLFVSHNMAAIENLCPRCIWIDAGRVRMDGPTHAVIEAYMGTFATAQSETVDLRNFPDRRGVNQVFYTGVQFLDRSSNPMLTVPSGGALTLRFHYQARESIFPVYFGVRLLTELGTLVADINTFQHDVTLPRLARGEGHIDLEIDALNLLPGRYYLSPGIASGGGELQDHLDNCARLDVEPADIYNSGQVVDGRYGITFFSQRWRLDGVRSAEREAAASLT
jgi:lipopolysaccharide transport system ATP-binding protein